MFGMVLVPDTILRSLAAGAILVGLVSVPAALTLLPAVLAILGDRLDAGRIPVVGRSATAGGGAEGRFWSAVVRRVLRRPALSLACAVALLIAAAAPVLEMQTGFAGITTLPDAFASKRGATIVAEEFPTAGVDPVRVVIRGGTDEPVRAGLERLRRSLPADGVLGTPGEPAVAPDGRVIAVSVPIRGDVNSAEAYDAVRDLRSELVPAAFAGTDAEVLVTGETAEGVDYFALLDRWLPIVFTFVLGLSFVLLTLAFRSVVVPAVAIVLNLLSVGAAYGLLVLVFQEGVGADLLGFRQVDAIEAWVPLFLFSVLFGLSMDYQVFLLSRIREHYRRTGSNDAAVAFGISSTARLITGAALIIIAVFAGFAAGELVMFQQMGFGVAVALLVDATLIRSVLVPAAMTLLGERNWYLPRALGWLPHVEVEGSEPQRSDDVPITI
jgi:RND superfamily putative drug exporter